MTDPYKVLDVDRNATDDEIKKAYRDLVRKYHPDKYRDSDLADLATEKMKEINVAYDEIQKMRASSSSYTHSSSSSYNQGSSYSSSGIYANIRRAINSGDMVSAQAMLSAISASERNAEWNFLMGCVLLRKGYFIDALNYIDIACKMDPNNEEYRNAKNQMNNNASNFGKEYRTETSVGCCPCGLCSSFICADCCCNCLGCGNRC